MSINWKELEKILSELPLTNSYIQKVTEHSYNSFTLSMFSKEEKAWLLYIEIGSQHSRICKTDHIREKSKQSQRFTQYLKAHIVGRKITNVHQFAFDRALCLTLSNSEDSIKMFIRLFSGPGANIIITDMDNKILEVLYRRSKRHEFAGEYLDIEERKNEGDKYFEVRSYPQEITFNEFIDKDESKSASSDKKDELVKRLREKKENEMDELYKSLERLKERLDNTSGFEQMKKSADLLSSSIYQVKKGMSSITLQNWEDGGETTLSLDPSLTPNENLEKYYSRYRKDKKSYELAREEIEKKKEEIDERKAYWDELLSSDNLQKLKKECEINGQKQIQSSGRVGLYLKSNGWDLIVGRNAKENDQILRSNIKGSDLWMHTRDYAGGYVFIKAIRGKSVPLSVLLDAASLAIHFSKAKKNKKADLYYTEAKYLRRIKGAKTGMIIPTQEKNMQAVLDEKRVEKLLGEKQ